MGTRLVALGLRLDRDDPALWNLTHPADVLGLHGRDVAAGSEVLLTNTFGANRGWLDRYGHGDAVVSINRKAAELARLAAGPGRFVLGDIGPSAASRSGAAAEQAAILVESRVDGVLLETYRAGTVESVLAEISPVVGGTLPIIVSLWEWPDSIAPLAQRLMELGASILGMNCRPGIDAAVKFVERISQAVSCPLFIKPSAAAETAEGTPAAFGVLMRRLLESKVCILGGCCGTTEAHVAALAAACAVTGASLSTCES